MSSHANSTLTLNNPDLKFYAWCTQVDDLAVHASLPVLNSSTPHDNHCHYDSGANRHVFHNHSFFEHYETIPPLTVKGFGENLSAVAIGHGTVRLEGTHNHETCSKLLNNVLHIPAARTNLISSIQLDKAGVVSTLGNQSIFLSLDNKVIVSGQIINDMYRLNVRVIRPNSKSVSLASHITPPSLASCITSTSPNFCTA